VDTQAAAQVEGGIHGQLDDQVRDALARNHATRVTASLAGFGLTYVMEDTVADHVAAGRLVKLLEDWSPPFAGYYLYYPSRRQPTPAFSVLMDALRQNGSGFRPIRSAQPSLL